jgi:ornithine carrier protein
MATATTADFAAEDPPALAVKGKEALMDAVEDILFGSVR